MASNKTTSDSLAGGVQLHQFRVFLASPGDVPLERKLAREAIAHINGERRFRDRINIEIIAWDQPGAAVAMEAGLTPQQAIAQGLPKPEDCDLAVIILGSRIGTPLPADFELKDDGSPYLSGTEWEYLNALKGYQRIGHKKPQNIWVYRRNGSPLLDPEDPEFSSKVEQWRKVKSFFAGFTNPDTSLAGGYNPYELPDDFRQQFEQHLRNRLDELLESLPAAAAPTAKPPAAAPLWTESPYPGLAAFTPEQAPIYFGRGREIDQLLQQFADPKVRFVAVVGVSGSGKSSLVMAGLLPRLRTGIIGNAPWLDLIFKPGERGGNPFLALAFTLKIGLDIAGQTENEIARALQSDAGIAEKHFDELLAHYGPASELLLFVDQFEELFTQSSADYREDFLGLLERLVKLPRIRAIVTMRADFYERAIEETRLANLLRQDRGTFPLNPPGLGALHQMIIRPAEAAGVELQDGLAQRLLDDAGGGPGAMALIAFTLSQLYELTQPSPYLTLAAYETFGGVKGAIQKRAESALQGLKIDLDIALPQLFTHLVEVNEQETATRRRAPQTLLGDDVKTVAAALTDARLLVSGEGEDKQATLEVAHETVLSGWDKLHKWITASASALRARRDLEQAAAEWHKAGRPGSALRTGVLLKRYLNAAEPRSPTADVYLKTCQKRRIIFSAVYAVLGMLFIGVSGIVFKISQSDFPPALATKALFVQSGLWPAPKPAMVTIPAGEFQIGDLSGDGYPEQVPAHPVKFATAFAMGKYEVTFDEYDLFAAATGREKTHDSNWGRGNRPAINVSWSDAVAYAQWLSEKTGEHYRLPSEAEWEYAARAGTKSRFYWGDDDKEAKNFAWFSENSEFKTHPVGEKKPNAFKLYDISGNVWEWVRDCYIDDNAGAPTDGSAREMPDNGDCAARVLRGGAWGIVTRGVCSAARNRNWPGNRDSHIGFRLARTN